MIVVVEDPRKFYRQFSPPDPEEQYVIGADVAEGCDAQIGEYSTACVLNVATMEQVAEYQTKSHDTYQFAEKLLELGEHYGGPNGQAFLVVEANPIGQGVINALLPMGYWNLYRRIHLDRTDWTETWKLGFLTTEKTRSELIADAQVVLRTIPHTIKSPFLFQELRAFQYGVDEKNGHLKKPEHAEGENDDLVFAWMLAVHGRRLAYMQRAQQTKEVVEGVVDGRSERAWENQDRRRLNRQASRLMGTEGDSVEWNPSSSLRSPSWYF